jgi:hypothetical protein
MKGGKSFITWLAVRPVQELLHLIRYNSAAKQQNFRSIGGSSIGLGSLSSIRTFFQL